MVPKVSQGYPGLGLPKANKNLASSSKNLHACMQLHKNAYSYINLLKACSFRICYKSLHVQGFRLERSESYCLLLLKYECLLLFEPTERSTDVVHLIE